jgi:8-oxo-dGTP pyrophosphatase MutT (NUDIX family)
MNMCCTLNILSQESILADEESFNVIRHRKRKIRSGTIILNFKTRKVLLIQSYGSFWGLPKGHIEENETIEQCAIRETFEETGITLTSKDLRRSYTVYNGDGIYFIVDGTDKEFDTNQLNSNNQEITGINWICLQCLERMIQTREMAINSHLRALIPVINKELST